MSVSVLIKSMLALMISIKSCEAFTSHSNHRITFKPYSRRSLQKNQRTFPEHLLHAPLSTNLQAISEGQNDDVNKIVKSNLKSQKNYIHKDVIVIGGGLAGLSIALNIAESDCNRQVTIIEKHTLKSQYEKSNNSGSFAAAGMLAPQSERLPSGPLLDICLQSRRMYTDFVQQVEDLARKSGKEGKEYLWKEEHPAGKVDETNEINKMEPWEVGFQATGGFLAPAFAGDSVATWAPPPAGGVAYWLDEIQVRELEPQIHPEVIGGWWFPEDASVDARRLTCSLRAACVAAGVQIMMGPETAAESLELSDGKCNGVHLSDGRIFHGNHIILANGSWMRQLLPVPITPHKGQSFSLRMPPNSPPLLSRVLFAQDTYIVPKSDGRIIVGATVEPGSFDPNVTPNGLMHCISSAIQLVPALGELALEETWSGLRPTTPDKGPILGKTAWENLVVAGGYWRNGVLLAPKTAQLISDLVNNQLTEDDEALLKDFSWDRFMSPEGGAKIAAASRYAASMHPVHHRSSGMGISASVGTELGFYSGAGAADAERKRDREMMFGTGNDSLDKDLEDAFEKAALMGKKDIQAFSSNTKSKANEETSNDATLDIPLEVAKISQQITSSSSSLLEGVSDAFTVGAATTDRFDESDKSPDLSSTYESIMRNKVKASAKIEMGEKGVDQRPDPGFRIYHINEETGEQMEVPPYTKEGVILNSIAMKKRQEFDAAKVHENEEETAEETLYDGYTLIQQANASNSRVDELEKMKKARMNNRVDSSDIQEKNIGAQRNGQTKTVHDDNVGQKDLSSIYEQIKNNKADNSAVVQMGEKKVDDRPSLDFKIYHVDEETGEKYLVPTYTTQAAMTQMVASEKKPGAPSDFVNNILDGEEEDESALYDGYVEIQEANGSMDRKDELAAMRKARMNNRVGFGD